MCPALLVSPLLLAGCEGLVAGPLSALDPAGPQARAVALLWWSMLAAAAVLFTLVMGLYLWALLRPEAAAKIPARRWIIFGGLVLPLPVLLPLGVIALVLGESILRTGDEPFRVTAHAQQWHWSFGYPGQPGAAETIDVLHIPAGRTVEVTVSSADVIHSFWVPRLGGKIDAIPGRETRILLTADDPGGYGGQCAEYCGTGHSFMAFEVIAHPEEGLAAALAGETPSAPQEPAE
ncbi:cytochrome c oxidase subunit II [Frigidibacter albus]|uniref:cytochrome-c oxidase n=1 Tax=Frigidibacter albus TaxID=1465486 RepID=A0A6L8VN26_9RHOB|nr:cytochrome c oxidase subunit II [Frigidibacter albus]MZQ90570.1 cytochrome c oxidase subunit II [Frigidibacter albus]NBE32774.1 cytochrome c oxidase subunit II [Frigidibacter albus]GGH60843.1 QoxB, Quinol oxidase subunit II [Frigidibacter albus]